MKGKLHFKSLLLEAITTFAYISLTYILAQYPATALARQPYKACYFNKLSKYGRHKGGVRVLKIGTTASLTYKSEKMVNLACNGSY